MGWRWRGWGRRRRWSSMGMIRLVVRFEFSAGSCLVVERIVVADTKSRYVYTVLHIQDTAMLVLRWLVDRESSSLNAPFAGSLTLRAEVTTHNMRCAAICNLLGHAISKIRYIRGWFWGIPP